jgi:hypothetical protein
LLTIPFQSINNYARGEIIRKSLKMRGNTEIKTFIDSHSKKRVLINLQEWLFRITLGIGSMKLIAMDKFKIEWRYENGKV